MQIQSPNLKLSFVLLFLAACGSSSSKGSDAGDGTGGAGGSTSGGTGGASVEFMVVQPCATEADYVEGVKTVTFPNADTSYSPKCLKVAPGDTVTFMASEGTFAMHPLEAGRRRGDTANNPITTTMGDMTSRDFTFTFSGFYGYYCGMHGDDSGGTPEAGVIWVH